MAASPPIANQPAPAGRLPKFIMSKGDREVFDEHLKKGDWLSTSRWTLNYFKNLLEQNARLPPQMKTPPDVILLGALDYGYEIAFTAIRSASTLPDKLLGLEIGMSTAAIVCSNGAGAGDTVKVFGMLAARVSLIASVHREMLMKLGGHGGDWSTGYYGHEEVKDTREKLMLRYKGLGMDIALARHVLTQMFVDGVMSKLKVDGGFRLIMLEKEKVDLDALITEAKSQIDLHKAAKGGAIPS